MTFTLSEDCLIKKALTYISANSNRDGITIDTAGYDSCCFVLTFATIASSAVTAIELEQGAASDMSDGQDLLGSSVTVADDDDDQLKYIDIHNPRERYLRLKMNKDGTNVCAESGIAILYNGRASRAITQPAGETEGERHVFPAEGTA